MKQTAIFLILFFGMKSFSYSQSTLNYIKEKIRDCVSNAIRYGNNGKQSSIKPFFGNYDIESTDVIDNYRTVIENFSVENTKEEGSSLVYFYCNFEIRESYRAQRRVIGLAVDKYRDIDNTFNWYIRAKVKRIFDDIEVTEVVRLERGLHSDRIIEQIYPRNANSGSSSTTQTRPAENSERPTYSESPRSDVSSKSLNNNTLTDIDGNEYKIIKIGTQTWMAENLKVTRFNDGTRITYRGSCDLWGEYPYGPGWSVYNYDGPDSKIAKESNDYKIYGVLYNWHTVEKGNLCPKGWHVPSINEWNELQNYLIKEGFNFDGSKTENKVAKALASVSFWTTSQETGDTGCNPAKNNGSGFNALPGGYSSRSVGVCYSAYAGYQGHWWSSSKYKTESYATSKFIANDADYLIDYYSDYLNGLSVRCLRN